jgi:hypothetical protein
LEERREGARRVIVATLDPAWVESNSARFDEILASVVNNNMRCVVVFSFTRGPVLILNLGLNSNRPADMIGECIFFWSDSDRTNLLADCGQLNNQ